MPRNKWSEAVKMSPAELDRAIWRKGKRGREPRKLNPLFTPGHLVRWRAAAGWTQSTLAKHLGVSRYTVLSWELGRRRMPPDLRERLPTLDQQAELDAIFGPPTASEET